MWLILVITFKSTGLFSFHYRFLHLFIHKTTFTNNQFEGGTKVNHIGGVLRSTQNNVSCEIVNTCTPHRWRTRILAVTANIKRVDTTRDKLRKRADEQSTPPPPLAPKRRRACTRAIIQLSKTNADKGYHISARWRPDKTQQVPCCHVNKSTRTRTFTTSRYLARQMETYQATPLSSPVYDAPS